MDRQGVDPAILHAWLAGRSIARGLPAPIPDRGGFRVDTDTELEVVRWVFPRFEPRLGDLGRLITEPRHLLKLCGTIDELRLALPSQWQFEPLAYLMTTDAGASAGPATVDGYSITSARDGPVSFVQAISSEGELAASGYAGEVPGAFVYDRIVTVPAHQRKGLGSAVMRTLKACKSDPKAAELLVATKAGKSLYETLGWRVISPYATAFLPTDTKA